MDPWALISHKTDVVSNKLFGKSEAYLVEALKLRERKIKGSVIFSVAAILSFLGTTIYFIAQGDQKSFCMWIGSAGVSLIATMVSSEMTFNYGKEAVAYSKGCLAFKELDQSFEEFKKNPEEHAVSQLLIKFKDLSNKEWISYGIPLMKREDALMFYSFGQYLFMNNLVQILKSQGSDSSLVLKWKEELKALVDPHAQYPVTNLWNSLGVKAPEQVSCLTSLPPWANKVYVIDKMKEVFDSVLKESIRAKII